MEKKTLKKVDVIVAARVGHVAIGANMLFPKEEMRKGENNRKQSTRPVEGVDDSAYVNFTVGLVEALETLEKYDLPNPSNATIYIGNSAYNAFMRYLNNVKVTRNSDTVQAIDLFVESKEGGMSEIEESLWRRVDELLSMDKFKGVTVRRAYSLSWVEAKLKDPKASSVDKNYAGLAQATWNELPEAQFDGFEIIEDESEAF